MRPPGRSLFALALLAVLGCEDEAPRPGGGAGAPLPLATGKKGDEAEQRKSAWLRASLTGRDNPVARIRRADISEEGAGYKVFVQNQMQMTCGLVFGSDGRPAELVTRAGQATACVGPEGWRSREQNIKLECSEAGGNETCQGKYRLSSPEGFADAAVLEIIRPLADDGGAPPPSDKPAGDPCQGLRCRGQPDGTSACVLLSDKPGDHVLCVCRGGSPANSGKCAPGTTCQDANDGKAACKK